MKKIAANVFWFLLAIAGVWAYATLASHRREPLNSAFILIAALCTYAIGYRFYSKWIAARVLALNDRRATPCEVHDDGKDFCKTNRWIVFGHHFAAISGPGPLVGPVLAAQFGYLPGTLWILIGVVLGGAVQDFVVLFASIRRNGKSLGQMLKEELNAPAGFIASIAILAIMVILLAVLALVVVNALAESPWGIFTVGATIPIAMFMGGYMRFWRVGKVLEASAIGVALLLLAVWGGQFVHSHAGWARQFTFRAEPIAWAIVVYGLAASVLPIWLLLAPRDYLSTFMKLGTIFLLALGILVVLPELHMPALTSFGVLGNGPVFAGKIFPFCFITIACGAISGFHSLIASGTTPKIISRENHARTIGYGAMCLESLVAIMALIAACTLEPGIYLGMNVKSTGENSQAQAAMLNEKIHAANPLFVVNAEEMDRLAADVKEKTLFNRAGGAATLAAGMAKIFSNATKGRWLDLWYHFAIMFEALFILTTLDAGTRVGRYILQDFLGDICKPLGDTRNLGANVLASGLMVCAWGYFLIQGVRDPLGGVNSLWPLFGIANQMLAAIALCLATTIILKMQLQRRTSVPPASELNANTDRTETGGTPVPRSPALALITLIPLIWLVAVTFTAGAQKIFHPNPQIGFLAQGKVLDENLSGLEQAVSAAKATGVTRAIALADKALRSNRILHFNQILDAAVAGTFLVLVAAIVLLSLREWILLLARKKAAELHESEPAWLPDYAIAEARPLRLFNLLALAFALAKELSGEAQLERAQHAAAVCDCGQSLAPSENISRKTDEQLYLETTEKRFNGVTRCC